MSDNRYGALNASSSNSDAQIDQSVALAYWSSITADDDGVLGGYPQVSRADLRGSANFLAKLRRKSSTHPPQRKLSRVVDCGAGIGRVTKGFLATVADEVDVVEPVRKLTDVITHGAEFEALRDNGVIGRVYNVGLEQWTPDEGRLYDIIWTQWCCGQLNDEQLIEYFARVQKFIEPGGWLVVKENMSTDPAGEDIFDETDSSVTRHDAKFRQLFEQAGLVIVATELQRGLPKELYPVRSYALQPKKAKS